MTAPAAPPAAAPADPAPGPPGAAAPEDGVPAAGAVAAVGAGLAVLLAAAPISAVVAGRSWVAHAAAAVALVVGVGLLARRLPPPLVPPLQGAALVALLAAMFSDDAALGVLPGPGALRDLGALLSGAAAQIDTGLPPVPATPEILLLVTGALGVVAVAVHACAVLAGAPAAATVPLLAVFAVPSTLADGLLPWWVVPAAGAAVALLLLRDGRGPRLASGAALTGGAVALALLAGAAGGVVGTEGRFGGDGGGAGGAVGLSPFTALRGQLENTTPTELFRVGGLPRETYLRALTLREYVPGTGWQAGRPDPGVPVAGPLPGTSAPGQVATVAVENRGFRDYWLPLYGAPVGVTGVADGAWAYDATSGTAYTARPREEESWSQQALLPDPTAADLRGAAGPVEVPPAYLDVVGVDPRVTALTADVTAGRTNAFDRAMALLDFFTGPDSAFTYDLRTAPGSGDDALVEFLTVGRAGYCEQFASAMAVMLRTVGVPARVAIGFTAGIDAGGYRSVGTEDAHAWVEAWFPGWGWMSFDPTPLTDGRTVDPRYVAEARREAADPALQAAPDDVPPTAEAGPATPSAAPPDPGAAENAPVPDDGPAVPLWPFTVAMLAGTVVLTPAAVRGVLRRRRLALVAGGGAAGISAAWAEVVAESTDRGAPGAVSDTVRASARRIARAHALDEPARQALREIVTAVEAGWYGGVEAEPGSLDEAVAVVRAGIAAGSPLPLRARLLPASLFTRAEPPARTGDPVG